MKHRKLEIYSFETVDGEILQEMAGAVGKYLGLSCLLPGSLETPPEAFNGRRRQYKSKPMLEALAGARESGDGALVLGVTEQDIGAPGLNFVFGVADRSSRSALVSLARLRPNFYGEDPDQSLVEGRAAKEAIHELGHLVGLDHCDNQACIMHFSTVIEQTDTKGPGFCHQCLWKLSYMI